MGAWGMLNRVAATALHAFEKLVSRSPLYGVLLYTVIRHTVPDFLFCVT